MTPALGNSCASDGCNTDRSSGGERSTPASADEQPPAALDPGVMVPAMEQVLRLLASGAVRRFVGTPAFAPLRNALLAEAAPAPAAGGVAGIT